MPESIVVAESIARRHGAFWALRTSSFAIESGSATVLFGSNGAGKTTLIRLIATALAPSVGTLRWFGAPTPDRTRIAMLSHQDGHYDDLTALEHLELAARLLPRVPRPTPAALLERVGLSARSGSAVRTFSAGMRKRLGLARLLQKQAALILLDEPYASLDPQGATLIDEVVTELRSQGRTLLIATHQVERTAALCDRAMQLHAGRVSWSGSAAEAPSRVSPSESG